MCTYIMCIYSFNINEQIKRNQIKIGPLEGEGVDNPPLAKKIGKTVEFV